MTFEYGQMLWFSNEQSTGETLYMVINPPVVCETCKKPIYDWVLDEHESLECPSCGHKVEEFNPTPCSCGGNDQISLVIAANNNFGCYHDGEVIPYNHMVNRVVTVCQKSLEKEIRQGKIRILSPEETVYRKRLLAWTAENTYEPGTPMPEWVKKQFPMPWESKKD